ncbi:hypothetical protein H2200_006453 [Cladophialophora chaetospira]|uniref:Uncharacterized protein n=1 Tax=Cladophialophora chaetospira TaxID=386627 RepID=A0AA39CH89_9EURO|nr:hypothetical protein H2200_006453 [Cladophialophora chaetospira]
MAEKKPVLFMNTKTPGNFQGKRQQQEVRALALRAASFSRPNRRKKNKKGVSEESASVSSQETSASSRKRCLVPVKGKEVRAKSSLNDGVPANVLRTQGKFQALRKEFICCFFCGKPLEKRHAEFPNTSDIPVKSSAPWHCICSRHALSNIATTASTPSTPGLPSSIGQFDPFDSTPVAITADTHEIMNYVRSYTFTVNWPDELSACSEGGSLYEAHTSLYKKYFEHAAPMCGMLSYVYNLMALVQPERAGYHRQKSMEYSLQSFKGLRDMLTPSSHSDEQLMIILQTTWPLTSAEYSESVRTGGDRTFEHRFALRRLIKLLGGLRRLPVVYRELFVNFFAKIAIVTNIHTEIDPAEWDPGPWPLATCNNLPPSMPPISATAITHSTITTSDLPEIFGALRELVSVENMKRHGNWSNEDHLGPVFRWTYLRKIALKMCLWNLLHLPPAGHLPSNIDTPQDSHYLSLGYSPLTSLEPCLCLAAQLFIYLSMETYPVRQPWFSTPDQYAEMLARVRSLDFRLLCPSQDFDTLGSAPANGIHGGIFGEQSKEQDLLWIVAVGACFEDEMSRQQEVPVSEETQTCAAAGFLGQGQCQALQLNKTGQRADTTTEKRATPTWFSSRVGVLARRLGYRSLVEVTKVFTTKYIYDALTMDEALERLFDLESS